MEYILSQIYLIDIIKKNFFKLGILISVIIEEVINSRSVASATECTGLIPAAPPEDESEAEAYTQLYDINRQKTVKNRILEE
jgi:hypothetical protein